MILKFFNDKHIIAQIGIIILFLVAMLFRNIEIQAPDAFGPVYEMIFNLLLGHNILIFIIYVSLVLLEGSLLQFLVLRYNLIARDNYIVFLFWLILVFSNPALVSLNPVLIAIVLITWSLIKLFAISETDNTLPKLFSVGFIISFSSLIYGLVFYYFGFLIISLFILSLVNLRQILVSIISFSLPYLYLLAYAFVFNENIEFLAKVNFNLESLIFFSSGTLFWSSIAITILIALFSIFGLAKLISTLFSKLIQFRNLVTVLFVMLFVGLVLQFLSGPWWFVHPYVIFVPLAILVSINLSELKRTIYYDLVLTIIMVLEIIQLYFVGNA